MIKNLVVSFLGGVLGALFVTNFFFFLFVLYIAAGLTLKKQVEKDGGSLSTGGITAIMIFSPFLWIVGSVFLLFDSKIKFRSPIILAGKTVEDK